MSTRAPERLSPEEAAAAFAAASAFRSGQLQIRAKYLREFADLWPLLAKQADVQRWLRLNVSLVRRWQQPARSLALEFFAAQQEAQAGQATRLKPPEPMPDVQIVKNLLDRGPGVAKRARLRGLDELAAWEKAEAASMASGGRLVLDGGREALEAQNALGYMRVTDGDPCYFCAFIASRGAVYSSAGTAGRDANSQFTGAGMFKYHDNCGCTALPIFKRSEFMSPEALKYRALWDATYKNGGVNAFRKAYDAQRRSMPAAA